MTRWLDLAALWASAQLTLRLEPCETRFFVARPKRLIPRGLSTKRRGALSRCHAKNVSLKISAGAPNFIVATLSEKRTTSIPVKVRGYQGRVLA